MPVAAVTVIEQDAVRKAVRLGCNDGVFKTGRDAH